MKENLDNYLNHVHYFDDLEHLKNLIASDFSSASVVYTYGAWDLLHPGHIRLLARAKSLGDFLIVGVISDKQISDFKGEDRPLQSEDERIITVGSLRMVDAVISQPVYDPSKQLEILSNVDILTKGDDWDYIPGQETIAKLGGKLVKLSYTSGFSTTATVKKLK